MDNGMDNSMPYGQIYIHKTHSKRELIEIMAHYRIFIGEDPTQYNKKELQQVIIDTIPKIKDDDINYDNKYLCNSVEDFINYLVSYNTKKVLSVKEKENLMKISKRLNNYCKNDYNLDFTMYGNIYEIINDAQKISKYGHSPTIRKTLKLLNLDPKINIELKPCLSPTDAFDLLEQEKDLQEKKKKKITIRRATKESPIIVRFD